MSKSVFTVYFEDPYWVGVYQREEAGRLRVCKITFGAEPKDGEVYQFLLAHWHKLAFGPPVPADERPAMAKNPKRMQRQIARALARPGPGTRAQQAIALGRQAHKAEAKAARSNDKQAAARRRFELRTQKKKQRHKGR